MFFHIYKNRLKCTLRDKEILFWSTAFSFILAVLFNLVLSGVDKGEAFTEIPIAVVETESLNRDLVFKEVLDQTKDMFDITYTDKINADKLLDDNKIEGYILYEENINLIIRKSGITQTIVKSFLDEYEQASSTIKSIALIKPESVQEAVEAMSKKFNYLTDEKRGQAKPNTFLICFYSLIAMACLYSGNLSLKEITSIQADASIEGARLNVAPVSKMKMFFASMASVITVAIIQIFLLMLFSIKLLGVNFGDDIARIVIICITGIFSGALLGAFIGSIVKGNISKKVGIMVVITMIMCFLSGMMAPKLKYTIENSIPILSKININTLITDSFYSLYYYTDNTKLTSNIINLWVINVVLSVVIYLAVRRRRYESI